MGDSDSHEKLSAQYALSQESEQDRHLNYSDKSSLGIDDAQLYDKADQSRHSSPPSSR